MDQPIRKLFDPVALPARDENGMCCHPDLDDRWNMDDNEEAFDPAKFAAAGFEFTFVEFEFDAPEPLLESWFEGGEGDCSAWTPSRPNGEGWMLAGIWDTEDGPIAFYVRPMVTA
jgi:hypothetical protein